MTWFIPRCTPIILIVVLLAFAALLGLFLLPQSIVPLDQPAALRITCVVPDDFNGLIVIRYGQADPAPFTASGQLIITVPPDGAVTLPHAAPANEDLDIRARYASGEPLLDRKDNPPPDAIAFYHLSTEFPPDRAGLADITDIFLVGTRRQFEDWSQRDPAEFVPGPFN